MDKVRIVREGQPCRRCLTPVRKKSHRTNWTPNSTQDYYFAWWFVCPKCRNQYMVEAAKRWIREPQSTVDADYRSRMEREA